MMVMALCVLQLLWVVCEDPDVGVCLHWDIFALYGSSNDWIMT